MSSVEPRGQFVWHELLTPDTAAAGAFYPRVAGWKSEPWEANPSYTLWVGSAGPMGGLMSLPEEAAAENAPASWLPYIGAPDLEQTVAKAQQLGGRVIKDVTAIPDAGRFAVLADPQGAVFAVHAAAQQGSSPSQPPGDFSWHELATTDFEAALRFYSKLFGWSKGPTHDMGEMGYYQLFTQGGNQMGGMYKLQPGVTTPHWLSYVRVQDVDKAASAAKAAGGRVVNGPMEVPGGDWIAQIVDPQGAAFAVHQVKRAAKPATKGAAKAATKAAAKAATKSAAPSKEQPKQAVAADAPAKAKSPATRASARRPTAKKGAAKRSAATARKRASGRRVRAKTRSGAAVKRASIRKAGAARRRPVARKRVVARKGTARRRVRAKRRR